MGLVISTVFGFSLKKVADRCTSSADREIRDWVLKQRDDKQPVTRSALREYARRTMKKPGFKASISWLKSFLKRNDLEKVVQRGQETDCGKQVRKTKGLILIPFTFLGPVSQRSCIVTCTYHTRKPVSCRLRHLDCKVNVALCVLYETYIYLFIY